MSAAVLEMRGVGFPTNTRSNLKGVDLSVGAGEGVVLFGGVGSGKGTLLKIAAGLVRPEAGTVTVRDERPGPRLSRGFVFQKGGLLSNMSLLDNAVLPSVYHGMLPRDEARRRARAMFEEFGAAPEAGFLPALVSAEARIYAQLARALLAEPALLLLDDVFLAANAAGDRAIAACLERVKKTGRCAVLVASGELKACLGWADRFVHLRRGAPAAEYRGRAELEAAQDPGVKDFLD